MKVRDKRIVGTEREFIQLMQERLGELETETIDYVPGVIARIWNALAQRLTFLDRPSDLTLEAE